MALLLLASNFFPSLVLAEETACAHVKIEIKQALALERQAFEAEMKINNATDTGVIENVSVVIKIMDESGTPISVTDNPNDLAAKFYMRLSNKQNIAAVDGTGKVNPRTTSIIDWLLIPAPGTAGASSLGKKYLVGATLRYKFGGEETLLDVSPAVITVKPMPQLVLDYFLPQDVFADDPLTLEIEPVEPFTLGVRVKNNGYATAKNLKIDSAQPKIVENNQGLLINFKIDGSYVNDAPTQNTLLINFGDISASSSKTGRWLMETTLAGKFSEFTAKFSHSDELGGALTSILQATNAHQLIRDVRVDLPGRDAVRDFLAKDGDVIRVYESDGLDSEVTDRSGVATLSTVATANGNVSNRLSFPSTAGFAYVKLADSFSGTKALVRIIRSDAKEMASENVWLSKSRNEQTKNWEYWVNVFDVNTTGIYDSEYQSPSAAALPPVVQFIPDRLTKETKQVSFLVEASSSDGKPVILSAAPLPVGAVFTPQAADPSAPNLARAIFDWTPAKGTAGNYLISYTATDGMLSSTRSANVKVELDTAPSGPGTPIIDSPLPNAQVATLKPMLSVQTSDSPLDPATQVQFEMYADEAANQLVAATVINRAVVGSTQWVLSNNLNDNTRYWWRARGFDGTLYSPWVSGRFFVNLFNDPPDNFNLANPVPNVEVSSLVPQLSWTNSSDKDGDVITYSVTIYKDVALSEMVVQATDILESSSGSTNWTVTLPLTNHAKYYWQVLAKDALGAQTSTAARPFLVNTSNTAPTAPLLLSPAVGGQSTNASTTLTIQNSISLESDLITYVFEIDTVNTFDSGDKRSSGQVIQSGAGSTSWVTANLVENKHYWWRVKAQDGRAESAWVIGDFLMNAVNDPPPTPTIKNPGNGAWSATQQPSLEANPVIDPEGEEVRYQFEVYGDAGLIQQVTDGTSTNTALIVPVPLPDRTTVWWRVRAMDVQGMTSSWSLPAVLYVSTGPYQDPTIAVTSPVIPMRPDLVTMPDGIHKQVTIRWEGLDPNIEPSVALYYGTSNSGFAGNLIVDGLHQSAGSQTGNYVWDVTSLASGTYYIYAVISDAKGVGKAYAPGAVVIPPATQAGSIIATAGSNLKTSEDGATTTFSVRLGLAPMSDVVVNLSSSDSKEGLTSPTSLTFTPQNWATNQTVTVTGQDDCIPNNTRTYQVLPGSTVSFDPNYIGLNGNSVIIQNLDNSDKANVSNNPNIQICYMKVVSSRMINLFAYEYVIKGQLTNLGPPVSGVSAQLKLGTIYNITDNTMVFGAAGQGETVNSNDTITVISPIAINNAIFKASTGFKWTVTVQP